MTLTNNELKGKLPKVPCWRRNLEITPQILTPLQKLPKNVEDLEKVIVANGF